MERTNEYTTEPSIDNECTLPYPLDTFLDPVSRPSVSDDTFLPKSSRVRVSPTPFVDPVSGLGLRPPLIPAAQNEAYAPFAYYELVDLQGRYTLRPTDPSNLRNISLSSSDTKLYSEAEIVKSLNYGYPPFGQIAEVRSERPDLLLLSRFINQSLVEELKYRLFGLDYDCLAISQKGSNSVFAEKMRFLDDSILHDIIREIREGLKNGYLYCPYSYIFHEVYNLIAFVQDGVRPGSAMSIRQFRLDRQFYWQEIFSEFLFIYSNPHRGN